MFEKDLFIPSPNHSGYTSAQYIRTRHTMTQPSPSSAQASSDFELIPECVIAATASDEEFRPIDAFGALAGHLQIGPTFSYRFIENGMIEPAVPFRRSIGYSHLPRKASDEEVKAALSAFGRIEIMLRDIYGLVLACLTGGEHSLLTEKDADNVFFAIDRFGVQQSVSVMRNRKGRTVIGCADPGDRRFWKQNSRIFYNARSGSQS